VERRLLREIVALRDVTGAALLDNEGFVLYSEPLHDDSVQHLGKAIALLDPSVAKKRVTLVGESGTIIAEQLDGNRIVVIRCQSSANLGQIRQTLESLSVTFNALIP
tara:strand:+ start:18157 stop:18477 length:321 start_codon:yes stop_codon:yes gene_type:complete